MDLGGEHILSDFPHIFATSKEGYATHDPDVAGDSMRPLFDMMLAAIPGPEIDPDAPLQMLVTNLDWSDYVGRIAVGRIYSGAIRAGQQIALMQDGDQSTTVKVAEVHVFDKLGRDTSRRSDCRRHRCARGPRRGDDWRHGERPANSPSAAARHRRRADDPDGVQHQQLAVCRPRRKVRHQPASRAAVAEGTGAQRGPARRADGQHGFVSSIRPRRAAPFGADRNDAPRRLRAFGRQTARRAAQQSMA